MGRLASLPLLLAAALWLLAAAAGANEIDPDQQPSAAPAEAASEAAGEAPERRVPEPSGHVARAGFAASVVDREPQGQLGSLPDGLDRVFFFSELVGLTGSRVIHRWEHEGRPVAEVPFEVGGARWRVSSSKRLLPGGFGRWTVRVIDAEGTLLHHQSISHESSAAEAAGTQPRPLPPASMLD